MVVLDLGQLAKQNIDYRLVTQRHTSLGCLLLDVVPTANRRGYIVILPEKNDLRNTSNDVPGFSIVSTGKRLVGRGRDRALAGNSAR